MTTSLRISLRRAAVTAAATGLVATMAATPARALTGTTVAGPVVAADQHAGGAPISWSGVAGTGAGIGVVEATDGARYRNPWFASDYAGARSAGLVRGSFAVARPALPIIATAQQQADVYLSRLGSSVTTTNTLTPVLDLETTGGLDRGQLITWAQSFLLRVQQKTGRVPMLRTYAYFWHNALGDPDAFARYPLWIAGGLDGTDPVPALSSYGGTSWVDGVPSRTTTTTVTADDTTWSWLHDGTAASPWPDGTPGPPQAVAARPYDGAATVSWLPGDSGATAITAYHVTAEPGDIALTVGADTTSATLSGLANGTAYTFTVAADNAQGTGTASDLTDPITPGGTVGPPTAASSGAQRPLYTKYCARPASLVVHTRWTQTRPSSGVVLKEGQHRDSRGIVRMHVLLVDVKNPHVRFAPLMGYIDDRHALSRWARRAGLVAATNAGFFDLGSGAPQNPTVKGGQALFGTNTPATVVGFDPEGLPAAASVAPSGTVQGPKDQVPLAGWNPAQPVEGVSVYTSGWGNHKVPVPGDAVSLYVTNGSVASVAARPTAVKPGSYLLVARGAIAAGWARALAVGDHVAVTRSTTSSSRTPFSLAYAVGNHLVNNGAVYIGPGCKIRERQPARTAIGWTADRQHLILVAVDNHPHSKNHIHGVESDQMAFIMRDLGAAQAYMFDGGGSTEMVARVHARSKLTIRNYPSDGRERLLPLGFGIFRR